MRKVYDHVADPMSAQLAIEVVDESGAGGACHAYEVTTSPGTMMEDTKFNPLITLGVINFQNGPIGENGVNGITQEVLLAIVIDRLRSFQAGPFSCRENAVALTKCEEAMMWLHKRTHDRMRRGVEGTNKQ